ncbi:hypothetical protein PanWU01x14_341620 [Parasponia andersonii]|uniref:Uncharacterized protein n=1 Tax=Parasponia andersonii TaxID=3476 RepID=A0A2P5AE12_PARAD|nr:hypothetical protein PanWU01x14_341620 [Parasponia andersonii]
MGITSCNKRIADGPRKRTKKEESRSESLQPALKGKQGQGLPVGSRPSPRSILAMRKGEDNILAVCKAKDKGVRVYPLEADPPARIFLLRIHQARRQKLKSSSVYYFPKYKGHGRQGRMPKSSICEKRVLDELAETRQSGNALFAPDKSRARAFSSTTKGLNSG